MTKAAPSRTLIALLLAVMLCGKLLVPAGWMPVAVPGGLSVMLCTGDGPARAWIDGAGNLRQGHAPADQPAGDSDDGKDPCPFGLLAAPLAVPPGLVLAPLAPAATSAVAYVQHLAVGRGLAAPPPPPTGPPVSA